MSHIIAHDELWTHLIVEKTRLIRKEPIAAILGDSWATMFRAVEKMSSVLDQRL